jgi:putative flavoprotein involved in K+ transport
LTPQVASSSFDVVVIGGSQSGLAIGYHLARRGVRFVILDAASGIGKVWGSRWDSLKLFTPAQYSGLPGMPLPSPKDTYPSKDDVASYLQSYASAFDLPVKLNAAVTSLTESAGRYVATTADEAFIADQVVVATGPFQTPFVPPVTRDLDEGVVQIHSAGYRNPDQLPDGDVLVVGGGNSGFQIAEELAAMRNVTLAVGQRMPSLPQRLLGRDLFWWLSAVGFMKVSTDSRLGRKLAKRDVLIGSSPKKVRRSGVALRPRLTKFAGRRAVFEDGREQAVYAIIWATGYRPDFSWIHIEAIKGERGGIAHKRGVTSMPGLFFLGLPWQHTRGSALIGFVKEDAAFIARHLESRLADRRALDATDIGRTQTHGGIGASETRPPERGAR